MTDFIILTHLVVYCLKNDASRGFNQTALSLTYDMSWENKVQPLSMMHEIFYIDDGMYFENEMVARRIIIIFYSLNIRAIIYGDDLAMI